MATEYAEKEYELNGVNYLVEVEISASLVDESFDHEFGTHDPGSGFVLSDINEVYITEINMGVKSSDTGVSKNYCE